MAKLRGYQPKPSTGQPVPPRGGSGLVRLSNDLAHYGHRRPKYRNKKVSYDGHTFDSTAEMNRYMDLKVKLTAGHIRELEIQKRICLQPSFRYNGRLVKEIVYVADFVYFHIEKKKLIVEDVKGFQTQAFKLKWKMLQYKMKDRADVELWKLAKGKNYQFVIVP